jgi:hypothetical protein
MLRKLAEPDQYRVMDVWNIVRIGLTERHVLSPDRVVVLLNDLPDVHLRMSFSDRQHEISHYFPANQS